MDVRREVVDEGDGAGELVSAYGNKNGCVDAEYEMGFARGRGDGFYVLGREGLSLW